MVNTGCPDCDRSFIDKGDYCSKHKLEFLKSLAERAQKNYEEAKAEYERIQSEHSTNKTDGSG